MAFFCCLSLSLFLFLFHRHSHSLCTGSDLRSFAASRLVSGQAVLYGINVDHDNLRRFAETQAPVKEVWERDDGREESENEQASGSGASSSPYRGGEWRRDGPGQLAHVVIGESAILWLIHIRELFCKVVSPAALRPDSIFATHAQNHFSD